MSTTTIARTEPGTVEWRALAQLRLAYSDYCIHLTRAWQDAANELYARDEARWAFHARMEAGSLAWVLSGQCSQHAYPLVPGPRVRAAGDIPGDAQGNCAALDRVTDAVIVQNEPGARAGRADAVRVGCE